METLRVSLIGPGNIDLHYKKILKINQKKFKSELKGIAKVLAQSNYEIELTPNKGIAFEITKLYKKFKGKKAIATFPKSDKRYGIKHLKPYLDEKIFDEFIDTKDWRDQNRLKGFFGDVVLFLGITPGTFMELNYSTYLFKFMKGLKQGLKLKGIHPAMRVDKNIPYTYLIYSPFIKSKKLPAETKSYLKEYGINLIYIKNARQLKEELMKLK